jgi:hypothetical protein
MSGHAWTTVAVGDEVGVRGKVHRTLEVVTIIAVLPADHDGPGIQADNGQIYRRRYFALVDARVARRVGHVSEARGATDEHRPLPAGELRSIVAQWRERTDADHVAVIQRRAGIVDPSPSSPERD